MDKLKGKKIVNMCHDSAYGKETIPVLDARRRCTLHRHRIPVPHPGYGRARRRCRSALSSPTG